MPHTGSKGCKSYNPTLALRQLEYPMPGKLEDKALEEIVLHDMGVRNIALLQNIIRARGKVYSTGTELGKNCITKEPYPQWVLERVQIVKFPFSIELLAKPVSLELIPISIKEVNKFRATVFKLEQEMEELQASLNRVSYERNKLRFNLNQNEEHLK